MKSKQEKDKLYEASVDTADAKLDLATGAVEDWRSALALFKEDTNKMFKSLKELGYDLEDDEQIEKLQEKTNVATKANKEQETPDPEFKRAVLATEIIHQLHEEPTFDRTKLESLLFLAEHICNEDT